MPLWGAAAKAPPPSRIPSMPSLPSLPPAIQARLPTRLPAHLLEHKWYIAGGAATLGTVLLLSALSAPDRTKPIPSPKDTLPLDVLRTQAYPPDALPGARDVDTPYGSIRVYEWGPEKGDRVLMIHGISTPSVALAGVFNKLVKKGCRVMMFDLFGRGYSSTPSPKAYNYDSALYTTQILLCLQSSPLSWSSYVLLGYSLGGAIAADFTSYFPHHVKALVLVAPGGLIRKEHISTSSKILYSRRGLLPNWLVESMVAGRLRAGPEAARTIEPRLDLDDDESDRRSVRSRTGSVYSSSSVSLLPPTSNQNRTAADIIEWQIKNQPGFVPAFISSIRYAPTHDQQERWKIIGQNMRDRYYSNDREKSGPKEVWLVLGEADPIIIADELIEDATKVLGEKFIRIKTFDGVGHDVPMVRPDEVARVVLKILDKGHKK